MKSLDTNILLRYVLGDSPEQYKAVYKLLTQTTGPNSFAIADGVFFEMVWIMSGPFYKFERPTIIRAIERVMDLSQINCNRTWLEQVLPLYEQHPKLSFIDCSLSAYAELNKAAPLLTFDKRLASTLPNSQLLKT